MNTEELWEEIRIRGYVERLIHIGQEQYREGFNLKKRPDGKWESSFVERGYPNNRREYETEAEAAEGFLEFLEKSCCPKQRIIPPFLFERWRRRRQEKKNKGIK